MKGAREKAIDVMSRRYFPVPGNSERSIATHDIEGLESAGLRIVDAELHQALIEAMRARMWADMRGRVAIRYGIEERLELMWEQDRRFNAELDVARRCASTAVELLERGE
jgi:hypothetical protein